MASPTSVISSPPVLAPPQPVTTKVRYIFIQGGNPIFYVDGPPATSVPVPVCLGDGWTVEAWAMAGDVYATVKDTETFDGDDPGDVTPTPNDGDIPPVTNLTLEYSI